ncbi:(3,5-dihydroxyphenyl)acetyl-CoA 1,2-dioxygenase DpgC [Streptomyces sp. NRRL S-87]|uniref:(3,5-dihydroxyphenyl)acetyl-CoA 1,2-dioxygenase DpgC n=1 Tax=Streptomyces sp. NRRL S-87 TaxID=1463920 RepID=UPI0004C29F1F|nr:(3,5-dihydroxyphenyl)acetyl-CoA 1,2-dioxygenase DpgC [Streptomyces sp. NRRL S-87]
MPRTTAPEPSDLPAPPDTTGDFTADAARVGAYLREAGERTAGLPPRRERSPEQQERVEGVRSAARTARLAFVREHGGRLHDALTDGGRTPLGLRELAFGAADFLPGLVPTAETVAAERRCTQPEKEGHEVDQGILFWGLLRAPEAGRRILDAMRRPMPRSLGALAEFRRTGTAALGTVTVERRDGIGHVTVHNLDCLNAEDDALADDFETAVDLVLLDDGVRAGVVRGAPMTHTRYAGRRVFSSGINLTRLYNGQISFVDFLLRREVGYIHKILRGLSGVPGEPAGPFAGGGWEKPWLAAVDTFAIGGGMQLLLVFDQVVAENDAYFSLPAVQEGIVPGAANFRLGRVLGHRRARQVILGGRKIRAADPDGLLLADDVVEPEQMDKAVRSAAEALDNPSVTANRRMLNLADEPEDGFRRYMAEFSLEQSRRLYSADVMDNLERTWISRSRRS